MYRPTSSHRSSQQEAMRPPKIPDRPLVPYMRFSKKMWPKVRADKPDVPLWELGKLIGQLWNGTPPAEKGVFTQEYEQEKIEYEKAMKQYNVAYAQYMAAKSRVKSAHQQHQEKGGGSGRKAAAEAVTGVFMQPIDEEDPFELAGKRLAAIRYDRNNRLMAELFSPAYLPDPRSFVPQQRIDHFRRQRMSLEQHQVKSNDELARMDELFSQRKRAIQRDSEAYQGTLKKVCEERPRVDQQRCDELTEQYKEQLLNAWDQFQAKQAAIQAKLEADRRANPVLAELITSKSPAQEEEEAVEGVKKEETQQQQQHQQMEDEGKEVLKTEVNEREEEEEAPEVEEELELDEKEVEEDEQKEEEDEEEGREEQREMMPTTEEGEEAAANGTANDGRDGEKQNEREEEEA
uniref:HMG box domain-containing protein n=1 Tax=Globodera pallida TaxID=36090 RepID=A0A183BP57_GLOPA